MHKIRLSRDQIDSIFAQAKTQHSYLLSLYEIAFPFWDKIAKIKGFPQVSPKTNEYLTQKAIEFDKIHHPTILPSGLWIHKGFGSDESLTDWIIDTSRVEITFRPN